MPVLCELCNPSCDRVEFLARDRPALRRFPGIGFEGRVPDAMTAWHCHEMPAQPGKAEELLRRFNEYPGRQGFSAQGGRILDASLAKAPRNRNTRDGNAAIRNGDVPEEWEGKPGQKYLDARWTRKNGETHCGCKNHADAGREFKLVRDFLAADASVHDSQAVHRLPRNDNSSSEAGADSACGPEAIEERLREMDPESRIHRKGCRGNPPGGRCRQGNRTKSKVRVRAGHVFGAQANDMGGALARAVGMTRAKAKIGRRSLACNMRRSCCLSRMASLPSPA